MITVSSMAEGKIRELMQEEQDTIGLRVFVKGGLSWVPVRDVVRNEDERR